MWRGDFLSVNGHIAEVEGVHGVATESMDVFAGEVQHLVVVEDYHGGLDHDQAVHLAVKSKALGGVGSLLGFEVEAVVLLVVESGVVGACRAAVGAVEEGEIVLGVGIVGYPAATEPCTFALRNLFAEGCGRVDIHFDVQTQQSELLLDVFAEVEVVGGGGEGERGQSLTMGVTGFGQQLGSLGGVVVVAIVGHAVETRKPLWDHASATRRTNTIAQIAHHLFAVETVVDGLPYATVVQGACGSLHSEAEILGVEERCGDHVDAVGIFGFQLPCASEDFVFVGGVEGVEEVEVAFDEFEEVGLLVDDKGDCYGIEIGEATAGAVPLEIVVVAAHDKFDVLFPQLKVKGAGATGMLAEVGAVVFHHLVGDDAAVHHAQHAEEGAERLPETDDEGGVVRGRKTVHVGKDPPAG